MVFFLQQPKWSKTGGGMEGQKEGGRKGGREGRGKEGKKKEKSKPVATSLFPSSTDIVLSLGSPLVVMYILTVLVRVLQRGEQGIYKER